MKPSLCHSTESRERQTVIDAPAKLNLGLEVIGRRDDGFHEIATIFVAVDLYDRLTCRPPLIFSWTAMMTPSAARRILRYARFTSCARRRIIPVAPEFTSTRRSPPPPVSVARRATPPPRCAVDSGFGIRT